ncbi:MAG: hypothetical protein ACLVGL_01715 [Waltera sp.]
MSVELTAYCLKISVGCSGEIFLCISHRCGGTLLSCHGSGLSERREERKLKTMIREITALAEAMGVPFRTG